MIELIQFPWSPFCIVQRRILEFAGAQFAIQNIPNTDRARVWALTGGQSYQVPLLRDGERVVWESAEDSQVIAQYLDEKFDLGLFPAQWRGVQTLLWRHIEGEVEDVGFRLNDIYYQDFIPEPERLGFVRHKERKFGRGCLARWRAEQPGLLEQWAERLVPYEQMLQTRAFLLDAQPRFVDFDLYGMLGNFLASGRYELPAAHPRLRAWYVRLSQARAADFPR